MKLTHKKGTKSHQNAENSNFFFVKGQNDEGEMSTP